MSSDVPDFETDELEKFIEEYVELDRGGQRPKGIYSVLPGSRERNYQYTLKYFLDPQQPHGFGYMLIETFLDCINFHEFNLTRQHIEIADEVGIVDDGSDGRIDLVICGGSALADHPRWAIFLELKVGAKEGERQTTKYAKTDAWDFSWFDSNRLFVDRLDEKQYIYVKRNTADAPSDTTGKFDSVDWADIVESFETEIQDSIFEYPNRSVIQFTDFMQSLKETESMGSPIDEEELNKRLNLYFEHKELIQQVEKANSQFERDFEDLSEYLKSTWVDQISKQYDFEKSGWRTSTSTNPKWQGILPEYWDQNPLNQSSTIKLYYRHSPTTDSLRNRTLSFRLRLPPARNVHTEKRHHDQSFNDIFTEKCTSEYADRINHALDSIDVDDIRLGSASALIVKNYQLDPHNLADSYLKQLDKAVHEFCSDKTELPKVINEVFEDTYQIVFGEEPAGDFPGYLPER